MKIMVKSLAVILVASWGFWSCQRQDLSYPLVEAPVPDTEFYQNGLSAIERKAKTSPNNPDAHFKKAIYLEALGNPDGALLAIKQAISLDPTPEYLIKEAQLLTVLGDFEQALTRISRAQILGGDYPELWQLMAELNYQNGNYQAAISQIDKAIQKHPNGTNYFFTKGLIQWALNDTLGALKSLERSSKHPETRYEALKQLVIISRAQANYPKAFDYLMQNRRTQKGDRSLLFDQGQLLRETEQYDSALSLFQYLRKIDTTDYRNYHELALIHFQTRRYDSAMYYNQASLQKNQDHLPSMLTEARIYDRWKHYTKAISTYQEILAIDSTFTPAADELEKLTGKVAYLQRIQRNRERNAGLRILTPAKPTNENN